MNHNRNNHLPIIIMGAFFFIFGFATWLNGTLIPYLKIACELSNFQSYFVATAFYISYFVMALPAAWVLKRTGLKNGMMVGLLVMACGAFIFIPAAYTRTYPLFLTGLFVIGTGLSLLQTASNPYVTILGPIESAAKRISIMGICNKVAGTLAPIILSAIILSDADLITNSLTTMSETDKGPFLDALAARVVKPYTIMGFLLMALAVMVQFSSLPKLNYETADYDKSATDKRTSVFQFPHLIYGVIALFLYVGVEVMAGDTISNFGTDQGIPLSQSKNFTAFTLSAMIIGYIIGILTIPKYITQQSALAISAFIGVVFTLGALFTSGYTAVLCIALLGLANAIMWPAIWPLAIHGTGKFIETASALLIMAIAGGATLPLLYGWLADLPDFGTQKSYIIMLPCYAFIAWYALRGYKKQSY
ncbi:MAG: sugar MFS transporter [Bacteroidia bacterium]|nr:sugar MFS transporter [Bacteroidia bacterium]